MDRSRSARDENRQWRRYNRRKDQRSRDSCTSLNNARKRNDRSSRPIDYRRSGGEIPEDHCLSLFPSAKSPSSRLDKNSKENMSHCTTPQTADNRWARHGQASSHHSRIKDPKTIDIEAEFPPLGASKFTPESGKDWGSLVEEEEERTALSERKGNPRYKRKLLLTESTEDTTRNSKRKPPLTDPHKLNQRQKQIDIGKNTLAYGRYITQVPRELRTVEDPQTPNRFKDCSTRSWVGQIRMWRRKLHVWDPPSEGQEDLFSSSSQGDNNTDAKDPTCEGEEDLYSFSSQSSTQFSDELKMEVDCNDNDELISTSKPSSMDDVFKEFDLDSCLMSDGFPL